MRSPISVVSVAAGDSPPFGSHSSYSHQTTNHLIFDRIREVQLEVDLLRSYLQCEETGRIGGAGLKHEISVLADVSTSLFDDVYMPLREKWL